MNIKFLSAAVSAIMLVSPEVFAQFYNAEATAEPELAKPISLLNDVQETETVDAVVENADPDISYYVQNLNLSPEQLQEAQKISQDSLAKQEEIMQSISALRRQARALEINSLKAFESILDDTQKESFRKLRAGYENVAEQAVSESKNDDEKEQNNENYNNEGLVKY